LNVKYALWRKADEYTEEWFLMPVDHQYGAFLKHRDAYEPNSEMVWSFEAETFWEATARYREYMGYEESEPASGTSIRARGIMGTDSFPCRMHMTSAVAERVPYGSDLW
jgi:hypothetical protein